MGDAAAAAEAPGPDAPHGPLPPSQLDTADLRQASESIKELDAILDGAVASLVMPYASSKVRSRAGGQAGTSSLLRSVPVLTLYFLTTCRRPASGPSCWTRWVPPTLHTRCVGRLFPFLAHACMHRQPVQCASGKRRSTLHARVWRSEPAPCVSSRAVTGTTTTRTTQVVGCGTAVEDLASEVSARLQRVKDGAVEVLLVCSNIEPAVDGADSGLQQEVQQLKAVQAAVEAAGVSHVFVYANQPLHQAEELGSKRRSLLSYTGFGSYTVCGPLCQVRHAFSPCELKHRAHACCACMHNAVQKDARWQQHGKKRASAPRHGWTSAHAHNA